MKQVFFIAVVLLCFIHTSKAQVTPPELQRKIAGKRNLKAIMKEVEKFYEREEEEKQRKSKRNQRVAEAEDEEEFENGLLHWKRWEYFNKTRLKPNGDLEDVTAKTIAAWQQTKEKYGNNSRVQDGSDADWNFIGPFNLQFQGGLYRGLCRVDKIVFHPTDPNTIYVGTNNGGLWRTTNGGGSWTSMNFYFPILSTSGIVINPNNPNNVFVLTGDGNAGGVAQNSCGIWVTNDGGANWIKTSFNSDPQTFIYNGFKLVMMPGLSYIMFAATQSGLYRSTDSGNSWTLALSGPLLTDGSNPIYDIEFDPSQPGRVYASGFGKFYLSESFGVAGSFTQQTTIAGATRIEIGVSPNNFNYVYLLCGPYIGAVGSNTFQGLYRSTTGGTSNSFVRRTNTPNILSWSTAGILYPNDGDQSSYDLAIDVSPFNAELVVTGGKNVWRSTTGGTAMQNLTVFNEDSSLAKYIHPDVHEISFNPLNGWLYAGTDGGIYRSTDNGISWANITNGIHTTTFYHMGAAPFDVNRILAGAQDNGIKYKSSIGDFTHITGADGFDCSFGPSASSSIYTTVNKSFMKFDINGNSQTTTTPTNAAFFPVIAADPVTNNIVYLAGGAAALVDGVGNPIPPCGVQKTTDGGSTWTRVLTQNIQQSICTCPSNSNRVYATGTNSIFRTDNGGTNWTGNLANNPGFINSGQITDINVCSSNSSLVYVTMGGYTAGQKVFYSNDAGANWINLSGTLPAAVKVNCVAADQGNNAYIGTDMGVFYQAVSSSDWTPFYNELPRVPVTDLAINQGSSRIRASTYGHGIWETELFTACEANYILSGIIEGDQFFQASNNITGIGTITGGNSTRVIARAGTEIILIPGFNVYESNTFRAMLGPCESGPVPTARIKSGATDIPPVFMTQADKGDSSTLYKYGTITIDQSIKGKPNILIHTVQAGDFSIIISSETDDKNIIRIDEDLASEKTISKSIDVANFTKGKYYVQLYYNGRLTHIQELLVQ
jgi:photosystem II stability/assembly factor-like uncharacterized protein